MLSSQTASDGKIAAAVGFRGCVHHPAISYPAAAIVTESCEPTESLPLAGPCTPGGRAPHPGPMVVPEESGKAASDSSSGGGGFVVCAGGGGGGEGGIDDADSSSEFPQHHHRRHYHHNHHLQNHQAPSPPPLSCLTCVENQVPMVALECELPLSGRLSPPADVAMSAPFPPPVVSSSGGGVGGPAGDGPGQYSPVAEPSGLPPPATNPRSGCKRKLPTQRGETEVEETEEEGEGEEAEACVAVARGKGVHGGVQRFGGDDAGDVTCGRCGGQCDGGRRISTSDSSSSSISSSSSYISSSGCSSSKRRRLHHHEGAEEEGWGCVGANDALEDEVMVDNVFAEEEEEESEDAGGEEQEVNLVVETTIDLVVTATASGSSSSSSSGEDVATAEEEEEEEEEEEGEEEESSSDIVVVEASGSFEMVETESEEVSVVDETVDGSVEEAGSVSLVEDANDLVVVDVVGEDVPPSPAGMTDHPAEDVVGMQEFTVEIEPSSNSDGVCGGDGGGGGSGSGSGGDEVSSEDGDDDAFSRHRPPRISPFLNTPKQRKEERRRILKMSIHKMRAVEDPEHFLRRSVLINNTMKRLQRELREEKMRNGPRRGCYGLYRRASALHYDVLNNSYLLHDEPFAISESDRITDDMTDALVTRLESTTSPVVPTPSPSPCPADSEPPDTSSMATEFSPSDSSASEASLTPTTTAAMTTTTTTTCSLEVTSTTLADPAFTLTADLTPAMSEPLSSMSEDLMLPVSESISSESEAMSTTTTVPDLSPTSMLSSSSSSTSSSSSLSPSSSLSSSSSSSSSSCFSSSSSSVIYEGVFGVPSVVREAQSSGASCSSESQREKQLYADIDTVFNNLIHALGDS